MNTIPSGQFFYLTNKKIFFEEIEQLLQAKTISTSFERDTLQFVNDWINHKPIFELLTSGSTGQPKPIKMERKRMVASVISTIQYLGWKASDTALVCLHPQVIAGKMMIARAIHLGMRFIVVEPHSDPFLDLNEKWKKVISVTAMVPLQLETLIDTYGIEVIKKTHPHLRCILLGGSPISGSLSAKIKQLEIPVWHTYGMTETCSHVALKRLNGQNPDDDFKILPGIRINIDERECLVIEGEVCHQGKVISNDIVKITGPNTFSWLGRFDRIVNSGGIKIHLDSLEEELETLFKKSSWVGEFFLFGTPSQKFGEQLCLAFCSPLDEQNVAPIFEKTFRALKSYHKPSKIFRVPQFYFTASGKIDRIKTVETIFSKP